MIITVAVTICHTLTATAGMPVPGPTDVCEERIIMKTDDTGSLTACINQPALADWKAKSLYAGEQWWIKKIRCVPGDYQPRNNI